MSFACAIRSASSWNGSATSTGPKISSCAMRGAVGRARRSPSAGSTRRGRRCRRRALRRRPDTSPPSAQRLAHVAHRPARDARNEASGPICVRGSSGADAQRCWRRSHQRGPAPCRRSLAARTGASRRRTTRPDEPKMPYGTPLHRVRRDRRRRTRCAATCRRARARPASACSAASCGDARARSSVPPVNDTMRTPADAPRAHRRSPTPVPGTHAAAIPCGRPASSADARRVRAPASGVTSDGLQDHRVAGGERGRDLLRFDRRSASSTA